MDALPFDTRLFCFLRHGLMRCDPPAVPSEPCFLHRVQTSQAWLPSSCNACLRNLGPATILLEGRNVLRLHAEFLR
jgi:hypothetical protein